MTDDDTTPWRVCCALTLGTYSESIGLGSHVVTRRVSVLDTLAVELLSTALRVRLPMTNDRPVQSLLPSRSPVHVGENQEALAVHPPAPGGLLGPT